MKICWDNLEKLVYRHDKNEWQDKNSNFYVYKESCKTCNEPFLALKTQEGIFCNSSCAKTGENHPLWKKHHSKKTKEKMSQAQKNRKYYYVTKRNIPLYDTYAHQISFCEKVRRNNLDSKILEVKCAYCGKWFIPTMRGVINRIVALKNIDSGEQRLYCSENCKQECPIYHVKEWAKNFKKATSREVQPELRQMCFERDGFICQKCNKHQNELNVGLQCHHVEGIRWEPLESADLDKVITFCKTCHIEVHKQPDCGYNDLMCKGD